MKISGATNEGKWILGNVFIYCESRGIQLETIVDILEQKNCLIDWIDFYEDALKAQWKQSTILKKVKYALDDVKGRDYSDEVLLRLKSYIIRENKEIT